MHCTRCGEPLADGARFCSSCGTAVGRDPAALPGWARVAGVVAALVVTGVVVATAVVPSSAEDVAAEVVAGRWDCDLAYAETDDDQGITTRWDVEFHEDGTIDVEDEFGESSEGTWTFEDGELAVDFGDADLGNPELSSEAIDVESSLDEIVLRFEPTADDRDEGVGRRTLTCERDD